MKKNRILIQIWILVCVFYSLQIRAAEAELASPAQQAKAQAFLLSNPNNLETETIRERLNRDGMHLTVAVDWPHWDLSQYADAYTVILQCEQAIRGIDSLHSNVGYKDRLDKNLHKLECRFDGAYAWTNNGDMRDLMKAQAKDMEVKGSTLIWHMHKDPVNVDGTVQIAVMRDWGNVRVGGLTPEQAKAKADVEASNPDNVFHNLSVANYQCGTKIQMTIDWPNLDPKAWGNADTAISSCDGIANGITSYCILRGMGTDWAGKTQVQQKIKTIDCRFDGKYGCTYSSGQENTDAMLKDVEVVGTSLVYHMNPKECDLDAANLLLQKVFGK